MNMKFQKDKGERMGHKNTFGGMTENFLNVVKDINLQI